MQRPYNFSAGPAAIPAEVLEQAAAEMLNWHGSGWAMEMSHRGKGIHLHLRAGRGRSARAAGRASALQDPVHAGRRPGRKRHRAVEPPRAAAVDFVVTGSWSQKSQKEARKYARKSP